MNSDMAKRKKFGHLHLVYQFTIPLTYIDRYLTNTKNNFYKVSLYWLNIS